ncbi:hypothetical protein [Oceanobacillus chungangensis]|uniref:Uncharacterized protein n=1 Tax=Oceanobacillus chungangensis TaxID=1229152 RepID=A0A3D8PHF8_9BACI|nr:hypothetical protein [Oceanobacillus chungangensis]RDW15513.1 hypothetical protein CWR45_17185 [Oceanobacillus chungangensis]
MLLLKGVTGITEDNMHDQQDRKQFKKHCYTFITQYGGKVICFTNPKLATNYFLTEVKIFGRLRFILLNEMYPFVAFASNVCYSAIDFVDESELSGLFRPYYRVLQARELNEDLHLNLGSRKGMLLNVNGLSRLEMEKIAYWQPKTVGEVIFNHWD